ncbi:MAG: NAD(P)/FAD-dependent oxidoreductase, partial [Saprospiraceae bacterium]|nr:NAD(P)/FAD-dependent oxidoreductase [Saprospiraceae bacterium]
MEKHHQIAIIGAGTAGITVAAQLLRKDRKLDIAIIDPATKHYYQPAWTLVGAGTYNYKDTEREMASLIPSGATWIQEAVAAIDPDGNKLTTTKGNVISYDYLVVCPGLKYDFDGIEGLADTIDKNEVCSNYTDPDYTWKVLQNFKGGVALFTQPATPIKCGGAPQKIMYLADDYFRKSGVRKDTTVVFATPGSVIFGVEPFKQTLMQVVGLPSGPLRKPL